MKQNVEEYLWDNLFMEFSLVILWYSILHIILRNDFVILIDLKVFSGITAIGTIVWIIGLIREVRK